MNIPLDDGERCLQFVGNEINARLQVDISGAQEKLFGLSLHVLPLQPLALKNEGCESGNSMYQADLMPGVGVLVASIIHAEDTDQVVAGTDGCDQHRSYVVRQDLGMHRQGHAIKHERLIVSEMNDQM